MNELGDCLRKALDRKLLEIKKYTPINPLATYYFFDFITPVWATAPVWAVTFIDTFLKRVM